MKKQDNTIELDGALAAPLLAWYAGNKRPLPWRENREPYRVWLSEIMLQQTRVEAARGHYIRFLAALPTVFDLAACPDDALMKLWEGLGYYTRARNLKKAAQTVVSAYGGRFPRDYAAIRALPGVGDYTAGAICSVCFGMRTPAVDGNVLRVVTRLSASRADVALPGTKAAVSAALRAIYPADACGEFTQALMELGAVVCVPAHAPRCADCPLGAFCRARGGELWREIPVKAPKRARRREERTVFMLLCGDAYALRRRPDRGLLAGMWEFPAVPGALEAPEALAQAAEWGCAPIELIRRADRRHVFTHLEWDMRGFYLRCREAPPLFRWASARELASDVSLPTAFRQFLPDIDNTTGGTT